MCNQWKPEIKSDGWSRKNRDETLDISPQANEHDFNKASTDADNLFYEAVSLFTALV